jgi:hypothetical protein
MERSHEIGALRRRLAQLGVGRIQLGPDGRESIHLARDRVAVEELAGGYVEVHDFHLQQRYWVGTAAELSDRLALLEVRAPDGIAPAELRAVFDEQLPEGARRVG